MKQNNHTSVPDFEGYSPNDMHTILYDTFSTISPIQLLNMSQSDYLKVPILNQAKYLLSMIDQQGELKLTAKGFLPTAVVADIYKQGFIKDSMIERGVVKLYKETDSNSINLTRILLELSGLVKKRSNKLSLTKTGKTLINDETKLLQLLFKIFTTEFNWAYYDGYTEEHVGQLGFGFSLILLRQYGREKRPDSFYADKYFKAFPSLAEDTTDPFYDATEKNSERCYSLRTFHRFLIYFGLIEIDSPDGILGNSIIIKTDLFDQFILCNPPNDTSEHQLH